MPIQIDVLSPPTQSSPIVGIDLGTTNSLVAIVRQGKPEVLQSQQGKRQVPSVVSFLEGKITVGDEAKSKKVKDAAHTVFSVKRLLGRGYEDLKKIAPLLPYEIIPSEREGLVKIKIEGQTYTAVEISALILRELKKRAEEVLGCSVSRAVVTVPAYFNDAQRQATRAAGRLAGLDVLRIINEPTAASLAYGLDRKKEGTIAVYDLGGGTFDISILKLHNGIFEVLATHGDTALGGDDIDRAMVDSVRSEIQEKWGPDSISDIGLQALLLETAEKLKFVLSEKESAEFLIEYQNKAYQKTWTRADFDRLVLPILERTKGPCMQALSDAGIALKDLSDVILVGGPTRLKGIQDWVQSLFGRVPNTSLHPDEVVAEGAAIQADILAGNNRDLLLLDVVPLSLGLETYGGLMSPLISRNTKIPTVAREVFTTFVDNQTAVDIHVLQGEREKVEDNRSLARFKLKGIPPKLAGMPRIEVTFLIDADGILQVAAKDLSTGNEQSVEVRPTFGLTDSEVEKMLEAGMENAETDIAFRQLVETKNKAQGILNAAEKQMPEADRFLDPSEVAIIRTAIEKLKVALAGTQAQAIIEASSDLNKKTVRLAELVIKDAFRSSELKKNSLKNGLEKSE